MAQQTTGKPVAHPTPYGINSRVDIKDPPDTLPSDFQPPGVDEEVDYNSLEEALVS